MAENATVVGPETQISGEIRGEEDLIVKGRIEGKVQLTRTLTVDKGAIVQADVDVRDLIIAGTVVGTIVASESIRLTSSARVVGDMASPSVIMEAGAAYRGRVDMGDVEAAQAVSTSKAVRQPAETEKPRPVATRVTMPPRPAAVVRAAAPTSAPAAPASPPAFPRVAGASAPAWAKKKIRRR
jgi:cytoskeletal protein CcmA (bactofilin family)